MADQHCRPLEYRDDGCEVRGSFLILFISADKKIAKNCVYLHRLERKGERGSFKKEET